MYHNPNNLKKTLKQFGTINKWSIFIRVCVCVYIYIYIYKCEYFKYNYILVYKFSPLNIYKYTIINK